MSFSITELISGETPVSVSLVTLVRSDTGLTPTGVTLPIAYAPSSGNWVATFTDPTTPYAPNYNYSFSMTWGDGSTSPPTAGSISGIVSPASGIYTDQVSMETRFGSSNLDQWSNTNSADGGVNVPAIQAAIDRVDQAINYMALQYGYSTPVTAVSAIDLVEQTATDLAGCELYLARGLRDANKEIYGQMTDVRDKALATLKRMFKNRINDAARTATTRVAPFVELDPRNWPYAQKPIFPDGFPAIVP